MASKDHDGIRSTPLQLQVVEVPLHQLKPNPANPRIHSEGQIHKRARAIGGHAPRQIGQIVRSISVFGVLIILRLNLTKWWPERRRPTWPTRIKLRQPG